MLRKRFQIHRNSLFVKLLTGFMIIILLLFSFNVFSFTFFRNGVHEQIIQYNTLNMQKTVDNYEKHFKLIENVVLKLYFNDKANVLSPDTHELNYNLAYQLSKELSAIVSSDDYLYLENVFVFFKDQPFLVEKEGVVNAADMFTKYYKNDSYNSAFWQSQFQQNFHIRLFPAAAFSQINYDKSLSSKGTLIPFAIRNKFNDQMFILAMVDSDKVYKSLHFSLTDAFFIVDEDHKPLFQSADSAAGSNLPTEWKGTNGYIKNGSNYFFYQKGQITGNTYVIVIPNKSITSQIHGITFILIVLLIVSLAVSLIMSVIMSYRFNSPIRNIVRSIQSMRPSPADPYNQNELDYISSNVQLFNSDLRKKASILKHFGYINKMKNIYSNIDELQIEENKPFYTVLFHLAYAGRMHELMELEQDKASYFMREYIHQSLLAAFPDSVTLQVEKDQIITLAFTDAPPELMLDALSRMKNAFAEDNRYCLITIACNLQLSSSTELTKVYQETIEMLGQRRLKDETQLITDSRPLPLQVFFSQAQEQEFTAHLQAGNEETIIRIVSRLIDELTEEDAIAYSYAQLAKEVLTKTLRVLLAVNLDVGPLLSVQSPYKQIEQCVSPEQYKGFFNELLGQAVQMIQERNSRKDPIKDFAIDYIHHHYDQDISVESIADQLNLSRSYVSNYFKEKTGVNLSDYLNELRIKKACEMLLETEYQVQEIAARVGYQSANSFIRMFKKVSGLSPGEFRRRQPQAIVSGGER